LIASEAGRVTHPVEEEAADEVDEEDGGGGGATLDALGVVEV
jgi:hypothetical protein